MLVVEGTERDTRVVDSLALHGSSQAVDEAFEGLVGRENLSIERFNKGEEKFNGRGGVGIGEYLNS
jgi:hypothetical protein